MKNKKKQEVEFENKHFMYFRRNLIVNIKNLDGFLVSCQLIKTIKTQAKNHYVAKNEYVFPFKSYLDN